MKSFLVNEINTRITLYSVQIPIQFSIMSIFRSRIIDLHVNFKNTIYDMYFTVFTEKIKVFYVIVLRVSLHAGSQSQPTVAGLTELEAVNAIIFQKTYLIPVYLLRVPTIF